MACNICEATNYFNILNKVSIPIWTGSSEIEVAEFPCKIRQCYECGLVYENISEELSNLGTLYWPPNLPLFLSHSVNNPFSATIISGGNRQTPPDLIAS